MKSFYDMLIVLEQNSGSASVERFPQDFEQVLNFIAGGPWNFVTNEYSPFYSMDIDKSSGVAVFYIRTEYRGMSESGRHYKVAVRLVNSPNPPINRDGAIRFGKWKQEFVSYNPNGSPVGEGLPSVYFDLEEIRELGPDTDGREKITEPEPEEDSTPEQDTMRTLIGKLKKIQDDLHKDNPKPKWTPERGVYILNTKETNKNVRMVDLAKQVRDTINAYEKQYANFKSY